MPPSSTSTSGPAKRALPSKESALFKDLLNHYETRQLKKGQKTADQILKKFPEHGETMSMKGLILTHMGKREEGLELVKKGIRLDLTSHICWHVFGLIQKGEKNYEEALKSYTQALRFDKDNLNLLNDTATIQTHLRHYDALAETRHTILKLRPNLRRNWIAAAIAYHLNGNVGEAKKVLEHYERTLKNVPDYDVEHSEVILYHIKVLEDLGEFSEALSMLDSNSKSRVIVDRTAIMEIRARLLTKLRSADAEHAWRSLLDHNSECHDYYHQYFNVKGFSLGTVSDEGRDVVLHILKELAVQFPRANAPRRLALDVATGGDFKDLVRTYLQHGLTRGVPSLFVDLKSLYSDTTKRPIIEDVMSELQQSFSSASGPESSPEAVTTLDEPPTTYLWCLYYSAQQYSFLGRFSKALSLLSTAIEHTPTLPELYMCKARVLKRAGDLLGSVRCIEEARRLDGQDRFLNTKSGKYHLRAGLMDEAVEIFGCFTKKDAASPSADLEDMQSLLFLVESADALVRADKLGPSLKKYLTVQKVFEEIWQDQYDFHSYSLRRFNINVYLDLLQWEDGIYHHPAYIKTALAACEIYVRVYDDPKLVKAGKSTSNLSEAEKKAQKKAKKAAAKTQDDGKKGAANAKVNKDEDGLEAPTPKDDDPDGSKALAAPDPMEQAWKLLKPIVTDKQRSMDVWMVVYDVAVRRHKYLQAVKALQYGRAIEPDDPELHVRLVDLQQRAMSNGDTSSSPIQTALSQARASLFPSDLGLETYNSQYLQRHSTSAQAHLACAEVSHKLKTPLPEIENTVFGILSPEVQTDVQDAQAALSFLALIESPRKDEFRAACQTRFELATVFNPPEELARLRAQYHVGAADDEFPEDESKQETVM